MRLSRNAKTVHKHKNLYKIKEKEYHHNFWICYIIKSALCIGAISSLLLPVPLDHFTLEVTSQCAFGHISSLTRNIPSHCITNVFAFSHTICSNCFLE